MKVLLDTHVLLWAVFSPEKLSGEAKKCLVSPENMLHVSAVSLWEIGIKYQLGKIDLGKWTPVTLWDHLHRNYQFEVLDVDMAFATSVYQLSANHHRDPFDRMLIWQALEKDLTLVTNDVHIQKYQDIGLRVFW
jgi:PIN domain nuclease of toxin-antitoxin system